MKKKKRGKDEKGGGEIKEEREASGLAGGRGYVDVTG